MSSMNKSDTKTGVDRNLKALRDKAAELRRRMSLTKLPLSSRGWRPVRLRRFEPAKPRRVAVPEPQ